MADPLDTAVEELAPRPATTNFFGPGSSQESVLSRYANSRTTLDSARELGQSASRLGQSRWDRVARQRQQKLWGQEDEEYQARKDFDAKRGEFLGAIARIDETADDFEDSLNELIATAPEEALRDDAVKSILGYKQRVAGELRQERDMEAREARYQKRGERQGLQSVAARAAETGVPAERIKELVDQGDLYGLAYETGKMEREYAARDAAAKEAKAAAKAAEFSRTDINAAVDLLLEDWDAFPPHKDEYESGANYYISEAAKVDEKTFVEGPGIAPPGLTPEQKEKRRRLHQFARQRMGDVMGTPTEGVDVGAQTPEQRAATLGTDAPSVPTVVRGGVTYKLVDGEWVIE